MFNLKDEILTIVLPEGKTNEEILDIAKESIPANEEFFGKDIKVSGRCTNPLAAWLGHHLSHITKSVNFFDPKENRFIKVISH